MLEPGGLPFDFYLQAEGPGIKTDVSYFQQVWYVF